MKVKKDSFLKLYNMVSVDTRIGEWEVVVRCEVVGAPFETLLRAPKILGSALYVYTCFHELYVKFWPYHRNVAAEIETHQTKLLFSNLLFSNFGEPVRIVASVCCSYLTGATPGVVFCCCSPSASGFDVLCVQRWYSAYLGFNKWLFELLLSFYHL